MRRKFFLLSVLFASALWVVADEARQTMAADTPSTPQFTFIPDSHIVPLFTADQRAHRLSIGNAIGTNEFPGSMGGIFPVLRYEKNQRIFQFSAAATVYTTLQRSLRGGSLINTDFFVDLFFDFSFNERAQLRFTSGHTSQHLSDDAVHRYLNINYVRDYFGLYGVYQLPEQRVSTYLGLILNHNLKTTNDSEAFDLSGTPMFQLGFEHAPFRLGKQSFIFWAGDLKFRAENDFGTTQNIQAGVRFGKPSGRTIRITANYASGFDERGQFYRQQRNFVLMGFTFDF